MMQHSIVVLSAIWTLWESYFFFGFQQWGCLNILYKTKYHSKVPQPLDDSPDLSDRTEVKKNQNTPVLTQVCSSGGKT